MSTKKNELLRFMRILLNTINGLSDDQIDSLLSGQASLKYFEAKSEAKKVKAPADIINTSLRGITLQLEELHTREEATAYIDSLKLKKESLILLGKLVNANMSSKDTKAAITEKLVEASVGARLRSKAIETINLKRHKND